MLATTADVLPRGNDWMYEFKWDGIRALREVREGRSRLTSRRGNDVSVAYPELASSGGVLGDDLLLDGEIVAFVDGRPSFGALQERMHVRDRAGARRLAETTPVTFVAFDLLRADGGDLLGRPLSDRRALLETLPGLTISPSFDDGAAVEQVARASGLEGVMAKRLTSRYRPGVRSTEWRKLRFLRSGDFVVVAWEGASDSPDVLSSLVLATSTTDGLRYAGKVGSGLDARTSATLQRRLTGTRGSSLPEPPPPSPGGRVLHWVRPAVVVEVKYTLVTADGRLRQPVFLRIREDKTVDEAIG